MSSFVALVGQKIGMSVMHDDNGTARPVTILKICGNAFHCFKNKEQNGYSAIKIGFYEAKENKINKPQLEMQKKMDVPVRKHSKEYRLESDFTFAEDVKEFNIGDFVLDVDLKFQSKSKGKGFAGVMKRHGFKGQRASHGNSKAHRLAGSTGQCEHPGRVFKGKKAAGHLGNETVSVISKVLSYNNEDGYIVVNGSIPGAKKSFVYISNTPRKMPKNISSINGIEVIKS